ncbi:hypothetical protein HDU91_007177, partial [Kappamyces sp. JEL0680]
MQNHSAKHQDIAAALSKAKRIVVVTGAGTAGLALIRKGFPLLAAFPISDQAKVPGTIAYAGLYNLVKQKFPGAVFKGQELFDASLFKDPTKKKLFYHFIAGLKKATSEAGVTRTHEWFKELQVNGSLARIYTQNIDDLDKRKLTAAHVVQLHGDLETVSCTLCKHSQDFDVDLVNMFYEGQGPACPSCVIVCQDRVRSGKRSVACGFLRPNIVLYNEHHANGDLISKLQTSDLSKKPDALIVVGTSLKIVGVRNLIKTFADAVHSKPGRICLFMNMTPPAKEWGDLFDHVLLGPCDDSVEILSGLMKDIQQDLDEKRRIRK